MKKIFIRGLPASTTDASFEALFAPYGKVHSIKLIKDLFSGQCKGVGFVEMEGHEAKTAVAELNGRSIENNPLTVKFETLKKKGGRGHRR
jgi:RNA recognition motif-containing protein